MINELEKLEIVRESWLLPYKDQRLSYDFLTHELIIHDRAVRLTPIPDQILSTLLLSPGRAIAYSVFDNWRSENRLVTVDNRLSAQITILRGKIDLPGTYITKSAIKSVSKFGYKYIPLK